MMNTESKPAVGRSELSDELERICREVEEEYGATGLTGGLYEDFAKDVALRAVLAEREACAKLADAHFIHGHSVAGPHFAAALADKIRERSNAQAKGPERSEGPA